MWKYSRYSGERRNRIVAEPMSVIGHTSVTHDALNHGTWMTLRQYTARHGII